MAQKPISDDPAWSRWDAAATKLLTAHNRIREVCRLPADNVLVRQAMSAVASARSEYNVACEEIERKFNRTDLS